MLNRITNSVMQGNWDYLGWMQSHEMILFKLIVSTVVFSILFLFGIILINISKEFKDD